MPPSVPANFDLYRLAVFCSVVEHRSFTRAAQDMLLTQPAISVHIRALERTFGSQLLDRSHREVVPTEAGQAVYALARDTLARANETVQTVAEFSAGLIGRLSLSATRTVGDYLLPDTLARFRQQHPGARIRMRIGTRSRVIEEVVSGDVDLGYIEEGDLPNGLTHEPMHSEDLVFFASPSHPLVKEESRDLDELRKQELVTGISGTSYYAAAVNRQLRPLGMGASPAALEIGAPEATKRMVAGGSEVGLLPRSAVADELARGQLAEISVEGAALGLSYQLISRPHVYRSPLVVEFLVFLRAQLGPR